MQLTFPAPSDSHSTAVERNDKLYEKKQHYELKLDEKLMV
jgi:hypothetical protein